jgi:hypothetical protein
VGSDVDLLMVVDPAEEPFARRAAAWHTTKLPVPADLLVYTQHERDAPEFARGMKTDVVWVYEAPPAPRSRAG